MTTIDLNELDEIREKASSDKADLFDFYHDNWDSVIAEIKRLREAIDAAMEKKQCN